MVYKAILFWLLCSLTGYSFALSGSIAHEKLYEKAYSAFKNNQFKEADIHLKNLIKEAPSHLSSRILMAELHIAQGKGSLAEDALNIAANLGADRARLELLFAESYLLQAKYNQVLLLDNESTGDIPTQIQYLVLKGFAHIGLRQLELAELNFTQALNFNQSNIRAKLGLTQIKINYFKYAEAEQLVNEVLASYLPPAKAWFYKATINHKLDKNAQALAAINKAISLNNVDINSLMLRASLLLELQDIAGAEDDIEAILAIAPSEPRAEFLKALILSEKGDKQTKKDQIVKVIEILNQIPQDILIENPAYYYLSAHIFYGQGNYDIAKQQIDSYLAIDQYNTKAMRLSATIAMAKGDLNDANSILKRANVVNVDEVQTLNMLGVISLELKEFDKALFFFNKVKELSPTSSPSSKTIDVQIAKTQLELGNYQSVVDTLSSEQSNANLDTVKGFLLTEAYLKLNQYDQAIKTAQNMVSLNKSDPDIIHHLGFVYLLNNQLDIAEQHFVTALAINTTHVKSIISLARLSFRKRQLSKAITMLEEAIKISPQAIPLINELADIYLKVNQPNKAIALYKQSYELDTENKETIKNLALGYVKVNQFENAIDLINSYLVNTNEKSAELTLLLGQLYNHNKEHEKAIQSYKDAIKLDTEKSHAFKLIAQSYSQENDFNQAVENYNKAIAWDPNKIAPIKELSELAINANKAELAIEAINRFNNQQSIPTSLLLLKAKALRLLGQNANAKVIYENILKQRSVAQAVIGLSQIFKDSNEVGRAIQLVKKHLKANPKSNLLNLNLADLYIHSSRWQEAENIYDNLLTTQPNHPAILNNAAYVALKREKLSKAKTLALKSIALVKNQPDSLDTLGWIYYLDEEYEKALPLFRDAIAINYSRIDIKYHLALTLKALNRNREAIEVMIDVVDSNQVNKPEDAKTLLDEWFKELNN